ncbi:discoidin domain-containing protein [Microcystis aeruginosa]|uniref:discoidin domain-containing protein n=1 Tax=Microcystis aeruginosa TaxID=1126 RepID=UPI00232B3C95|nr:discoidin domain-containing protein [Microcystis aeruginosa]MDB9412330.1 discoidin domain-containing protein [Microcystis aeruginosa CS-567/02]
MKLTTKSLVLSTATFGLMLGVAQNAQAGRLITGVTISGTSPNLTQNWALGNVINGSGLPGNTPRLQGTHALSASTNAWRTNSGNVPSVANPLSITFQLGAVPTDLIGLSFWNITGPSSGTIANTMGVKDANLEYSTDGTNFSSLWTGSFTRGTITASGPQVVNFSLVKATHVRLNITSNHGQAQRVGFNEIAFKSIPEPSASLALLGLGLAGVGLRKRI